MRCRFLAGALLWLSCSSLAASQLTTTAPYQTIGSRFGNQSLRVKSWLAGDTQLCPGAAAHHAGWADIDDQHLFFWYHEARHSPETAPLLIWLQGEPGLSSLHGMLYENGPCRADDKNGTQDNPYSWTEVFNVVYLDLRVNVGFSYSDKIDGEDKRAATTAELSSDFVSFLKLFYEAFPDLASADLYIGGESYAGRIIPAVASVVIDYNRFLLSDPLGHSASRKETIPLRSIMLGNPLIDPAVQLPALYDASCFEFRGRFPPRANQTNCDKALEKLDACETALSTCSANGKETLLCAAARESCFERFLSPLQSTNTSDYDRRRIDCKGVDDCYGDIKWPGAYLNSPDVLNGLLQVPSQTNGRRKSWGRVSHAVEEWYSQTGEGMASSTQELAHILQAARSIDESQLGFLRPIDVLVYTGVSDPIFGPDGVFESLRGMKWVGRAPFRAGTWEELPWVLSSGQRSGRVRLFSNLCLAEIEEAGRMVAYDQPRSSLNMVKFWLQHLRRGSSAAWGEGEQATAQEQKSLMNEEL